MNRIRPRDDKGVAEGDASSVASKFPSAAKKLRSEDRASNASTGEVITGGSSVAGFVSTSVLYSSDGLFGEKTTEEKRISEDSKVRLKHQQLMDGRPLYDRLQEQRDQKDAEWKEKHNPFAPPKALDQDEIEFLSTLQSQEKEKLRHVQEENAMGLAEFMLARDSANNNTQASGKGSDIKDKTIESFPKLLPTKPLEDTIKIQIIKKKKKQMKKKSITKVPEGNVTVSNSSPSRLSKNAAHSLVMYNSDDSSSSDEA